MKTDAEYGKLKLAAAMQKEKLEVLQTLYNELQVKHEILCGRFDSECNMHTALRNRVSTHVAARSYNKNVIEETQVAATEQRAKQVTAAIIAQQLLDAGIISISIEEDEEISFIVHVTARLEVLRPKGE